MQEVTGSSPVSPTIQPADGARDLRLAQVLHVVHGGCRQVHNDCRRWLQARVPDKLGQGLSLLRDDVRQLPPPTLARAQSEPLPRSISRVTAAPCPRAAVHWRSRRQSTPAGQAPGKRRGSAGHLRRPAAGHRPKRDRPKYPSTNRTPRTTMMIQMVLSMESSIPPPALVQRAYPSVEGPGSLRHDASVITSNPASRVRTDGDLVPISYAA